jgi:hypothetical protein
MILGNVTPNGYSNKGRSNLVYFNSNDYGGMDIAETVEQNNGDPLAFTSQNPDFIIDTAEKTLLRAMIDYAPARTAMKMAIQSGTSAGSFLEWSCQDRRWLFNKLVRNGDDESSSNNGEELLQQQIPETLLDGGTAQQLRGFLKDCPDAPPGAFDTANIEEDDDESETLKKSDENDIIATGAVLDNGKGDNIGDSARTSTMSVNKIRDPAGKDTQFDNHLSPHQDQKGRRGSLDRLFRPKEDDILNEPFFTSGLYASVFSKERKAEMLIQESLTTLLRAGAAKAFAKAKYEWEMATAALLSATSKLKTTTSRNNHQTTSSSPSKNEDEDKLAIIRAGHDEDEAQSEAELRDQVADLKTQVETRGFHLKEAQLALRDLDAAARKIGTRLLDHSVSSGARMGVASVADEERLAAMLDEYLETTVKDMPDPPDTPGDSDDYIFGMDEVDDKIDERYGGPHVPVF